jgi:hypothetical protein
MLKKTRNKLLAIGTMIVGISVYYTTTLIHKLRKSVDVDVDITNEDIEENLGI